MHIAQVSRSPVAGVPMNLARVLNKYGPHTSTWVDVNNVDEKVKYELGHADIIHWHNWVHPNLWKKTQSKKHIIHYHSCPSNLDIQPNIPKGIKKLVVGQYHACLNRYKDYQVVRNIVDIDPILEYEDYTCSLDQERLIVAFSGSLKEFGVWQRKGIEQTHIVMNRVQQLYIPEELCGYCIR